MVEDISINGKDFYDIPFESAYAITGKTMAAAMELGHYFLVHAQICYGFMGVDESTENAGYILGRLKKHKPEQFTARDLLKLCKKIKTTSDLTESLAMLIEHGFIRESQPAYTGTGRPQGIIYSVNPKLYKE